MNSSRARRILLALCGTSSLSAAPFENLDFDAANTNRLSQIWGLPVGSDPDLLPGWTVSVSARPLPWVNYNWAPLGPGWVALVPKDKSLGPGLPYPVFGRYSVAMSPTAPTDPSQFSPITLSQRGDVPAGTIWLSFLTYGDPLQVRVNGSLIPLVYDQPYDWGGVKARTGYGDITVFAGQTVELSFTAVEKPDIPRALFSGLDSIAFVVPEPSTWLLLGLAGVGLLAGQRWRHRSAHSTK